MRFLRAPWLRRTQSSRLALWPTMRISWRMGVSSTCWTCRRGWSISDGSVKLGIVIFCLMLFGWLGFWVLFWVIRRWCQTNGEFVGFVWCDLSFFPSLVPLRVCDLRLHFCCFFYGHLCIWAQPQNQRPSTIPVWDIRKWPCGHLGCTWVTWPPAKTAAWWVWAPTTSSTACVGGGTCLRWRRPMPETRCGHDAGVAFSWGLCLGRGLLKFGWKWLV